VSIRLIKYKDFILRGIKTPLFPYEILLPENYYMIYCGYEDLGLSHINEDLDYNLINSDKFGNEIIVFNLNQSRFDHYIRDFEEIDSDEEILDEYKNRVNKSSIIVISFNKDHSINNVYVYYTQLYSNLDELENVFDYGTSDFVSLLYDDYYNIAREEY